MQLMSLSGLAGSKPKIIHSFVDPRTNEVVSLDSQGNVYKKPVGVRGLGSLFTSISSAMSAANTAALPTNILAANSVLTNLLKTTAPKILDASTAPVVVPMLKSQILASSSMPSDWDEPLYLSMNPDVAVAVKAGSLDSGWYHYANFGKGEGRVYASFALRTQQEATALQAAEAKRQAEVLAAKALADAQAAEVAKQVANAQAQVAAQAQNQASLIVKAAGDTINRTTDQVYTMATQAADQAVDTTKEGGSSNLLLIGSAIAAVGALLVFGKRKKSLSGTRRSTDTPLSELSGLKSRRKSSRKKAATSRKKSVSAQPKAKKTARSAKVRTVNF